MTIDGKEGAEASTTIIVQDDDAPLEAVEIDVGAEDGTAEAETKETKAGSEGDDKPKKKGRFQARIDHERALRGQAETTAERLYRENQELKAALQDTSKKAEQADQAAFANYAEKIDGNLKAAKRALVEATNSGDADKIADATAELGKISAEAGRVEAWKQRQQQRAEEEPEPEPEPEPQRQEPQRQAAPQALPPLLQKFVDDNPWFVPPTKAVANPEFDAEMHQYARVQGAFLEKRYIRQGKPIDQSYYDELARMTKEEFNYDDDGEEEARAPPRRQTPSMNGDATVTPARNNQAAPGSRVANNGTKITLTPEQRAFARAMVDGGSYNDPKTGKPLSYEEGERRYARALFNDRKIQAQKAAGA